MTVSSGSTALAWRDGTARIVSPRRFGRGFAAGMRELHTDRSGAVLPAVLEHGRERCLARVIVQPNTTRADPASRLDSGRFDDD